MAVTAPPRPNDSPAPPPRRGLGTGPKPPGIVTDHVFKWVALAAGLLVLAILPSLRAKRDEVFVESEG